MEFRCFFKAAGTNPEIDGPYYELSSYAHINGHFNFEPLTLGFKKGASVTSMTFRPIDPTKPIVLAVDTQTEMGFIVIDHHLKMGTEPAMRNFGFFKTDKFLVDCKRGDHIREDRHKSYWSVRSDGMTFVYGDDFPNTWRIYNCDHLCAFIGGDMTTNQLRMHSYLANRAAEKAVRREEHIVKLKEDLDATITLSLVAVASGRVKIDAANLRYDRLVKKLKSALSGFIPFIGKDQILQIIENNN